MSAACRRTIVHAIVDRAERCSDHRALVFGDESITYRELIERTGAAAQWLESAGIGPADKVAVLTANHPDAVIVALAALWVGATWVPANPRDSVADLAENLRRVGCRLLAYGAPMAQAASAIGAACGETTRLVRLDEVSAGAAPGRAPAVRAEPGAPAAIFFTGGTTGRSKGVEFLHEQFRNLADHYVELLVRPDDVFLAAAPLTHVAGRQCLSTLTGGATTVILPEFDPTAVLTAIEHHRVTGMTTTPTMLYRLLADPSARTRDVSSMRRLGYGAAPIAIDRLKEAIDVFGPVMQGGYGQTESPMLIAYLRPDEHVIDGDLAPDERLRSVGRPTPYSDVRIVDDTGADRPRGEVGEIIVAGDYQMHRYYDDPEATATARFGRYIRTGDLGVLDADGYLTITGRIKDMIITGGFNVYAAEVESALAAHPSVYEAAVFGRPDTQWGESVNAAVQLRPGAVADVDELRSWVRARLGGVKTPKRIDVVADIPRNSNGKVLKRLLVPQFESSG